MTKLLSVDLKEDPVNTSRRGDEAVRRFREHDEVLFERRHKIHHDEAQLIASAKQGAEELERLFEQDTDITK